MDVPLCLCFVIVYITSLTVVTIMAYPFLSITSRLLSFDLLTIFIWFYFLVFFFGLFNAFPLLFRIFSSSDFSAEQWFCSVNDRGIFLDFGVVLTNG